MKRRFRRVVGSKNTWITPRLLNSKHKKLGYARISKEGCQDLALGGVHIVLKDF
jgi:hypothetical protein